MNAQETSSTRPYMIRALHEWCTDNGLTPYLAVRVDASVQVPREFVKDGEIVLNASYDATGGMQLGNEYITFKARFGGQPRDISVPVGRVIAIYARETGEGMAFPLVEGDGGAANAQAQGDDSEPAVREPVHTESGSDAPVIQLVPADDDGPSPPPRTPAPVGARPALKRVK